MVFVARVSYYNEIDETIDKDCIAVSGTSFTDATKKVEEYYGDVLEDMSIKLIESEHDILNITEEIVAALEDGSPYHAS